MTNSIIPYDSPALTQVELPGKNKPADGFTLVHAKTDAEIVTLWLNRFLTADYSKNTAVNARKEAERFLHWISIRGQTLSDVLIEDCIEYRKFMAAPPAELIGPPRPRFLSDGTPNPKWRPFAGPLSLPSEKQAVTILFGLFEFMCGTGYLAKNPWRFARPKTAAIAQDEEIERFLDVPTWRWLLSFLEQYQQQETGRYAYPRLRWMFLLFYLTGARLSEVAMSSMSNITVRRGRWWIRVVGKGAKKGDIPLSGECIDELKRYRLWAGLPPLPLASESEVPLISDGFGSGRRVSRSTVAKLIKEICVAASKEAPDVDMRDQLAEASTHWLRHTAASHMLNEAKMPMLSVSKILRHNDIRTTQRYTHKNKDDLHDQASKHVIDPS
jgi:integrase/recombinase XerD